MDTARESPGESTISKDTHPWASASDQTIRGEWLKRCHESWSLVISHRGHLHQAPGDLLSMSQSEVSESMSIVILPLGHQNFFMAGLPVHRGMC